MELPSRSYDLYSYFDVIQLFGKKRGLFQLCYLPFLHLFETLHVQPPHPKKKNVSDSSRRRQKGTRCNWLQVASLASEPSVEGMHVAEHRLGEYLHGLPRSLPRWMGVVGVVPMPRNLNIQNKERFLDNPSGKPSIKMCQSVTCTNKMNFP